MYGIGAASGQDLHLLQQLPHAGQWLHPAGFHQAHFEAGLLEFAAFDLPFHLQQQVKELLQFVQGDAFPAGFEQGQGFRLKRIVMPFPSLKGNVEGEVLDLPDQPLQQHLQVMPPFLGDRKGLQSGREGFVQDGFQQGDHPPVVGQTQDAQHLIVAGLVSREGSHLVDRGEGVPHPSGGIAGDGFQRFPGNTDAFAFRDLCQVIGHGAHRHPWKVVALAAGKNGLGNLVGIGGGQDEFHVGWRLFQSLQQGVEGLHGEHMRLIDDVGLVLAVDGDVAGVLAELADVVDSPVGSGVDLVHIRGGVAGDFQAVDALVAGFPVAGLEAVDGLGENAGCAGLAHAPCAGEEVGMGGAFRLHGILQRLGNRFLPD